MKLVRFGPPGQERPGMMKTGGIVDLRGLFPDIPDIGRRFFEDGWIAKVARADAPG